MSSAGTVCLIHFEERLHHAAHYLGWAKDLESRLEEHRRGNGAKIMAAVGRVPLGWRVVRTWDGDRKLEKALKKRREACMLCPVCRERRHAHRMEMQRRRRAGKAGA